MNFISLCSTALAYAFVADSKVRGETSPAAIAWAYAFSASLRATLRGYQVHHSANDSASRRSSSDGGFGTMFFPVLMSPAHDVGVIAAAHERGYFLV
jgi:hypothetical protein